MTGISNLGQSIDRIARLKTQQQTLDTFSTQIATGKKTQQFSGLNGDVLRSQRARADLNQLDQYTTNIKNASRRIDLMTNSLEQIKAQANNLLNGLTIAPQGGEYPDFELTQELAQDVYDYIIDLLNTKDGDRFLFAGSDSQVKPVQDDNLFSTFLGTYVPDADDRLLNPPQEQSGFIGEWGAGIITTEEFIAAYQGVNDSILGYSNSLVSGTTGDVRVRVDENSDFEYTVLANEDGLREVMLAIGVIKDFIPPEFAPGAADTPNPLDPTIDPPPTPDAEQQENFYAVINDLASTIARGIDKIDREIYRLSLTEAQVQTIEEQYVFQSNALQTIVSEVEDVDLNETVAKIQQAQVSLEASYSVTALISDLTLVNFLR
ncbi:MAG: hypothetical protein AAF549_00555 [Pseudomonadota bacterium]